MSRFAPLVLLAWLPLAADSPLTSTSFYQAYLDYSLVKKANRLGVLTRPMSRFLSSTKNPIGAKAALINALSWRAGGKNNAAAFRAYLASRYGVSMHRLRLTELNSHELMSLGYLMAMDQYDAPGEAIPILDMATEKNQHSYTITLVQALVRAQTAMKSDWCQVWYQAQNVQDNKQLRPDMRPRARDRIFSYLLNYRKYCN